MGGGRGGGCWIGRARMFLLQSTQLLNMCTVAAASAAQHSTACHRHGTTWYGAARHGTASRSAAERTSTAPSLPGLKTSLQVLATESIWDGCWQG